MSMHLEHVETKFRKQENGMLRSVLQQGFTKVNSSLTLMENVYKRNRTKPFLSKTYGR